MSAEPQRVTKITYKNVAMALFFCTGVEPYHYDRMKNVIYDFSHVGMLDEIYIAFWTRIFIESGVSVSKAKKCAHYLYDRDTAFAKEHNLALCDVFYAFLMAYKEKGGSLFSKLTITESMSDRDTKSMLDRLYILRSLLQFKVRFKLSDFARLALRCMYDILYHIHIANVTDTKFKCVMRKYADNYFLNFLGTDYVEVRLCDKLYKVKRSCILNKALMKLYTLFMMYGMSEQNFKDLGLITVPFHTFDFWSYRADGLDSVSAISNYAKWLENVADIEYGIKR